jgi:hypothetical protein
MLMSVEERIADKQSLMYFYDYGEIAYYKSEGVYYDPSCRKFYDPAGRVYDPYKHFNTIWFEESRFYFKNGLICRLPEQKGDKQRKPTRRGNSQMINFLVLGTMSTCSKTTFNQAGHSTTSWEHQDPCQFSVKSIIENRCMFWASDLYGHCSCYEAYQQKVSGNDISLDRIEIIKRQDEERKFNHLPPDHHFEDAENVGVQTLSVWYNQDNKLVMLKGGESQNSVFFFKEWDTFFNGHGKFLKQMTKEKRLNNRDPQDIVNSWVGPLAMQNN